LFVAKTTNKDAKEFTLGIEEEFQIIDPKTRELKSAISQMMEANERIQSVQLMPELHQSVVEVASGVCANIQEAREDVISNRREAARVANEVGMRIGAASTHPFSRWQQQDISSGERYAAMIGELQDVARANLIYGMHVHVGIPDREEAIAVFNSVRYFLPHILALTTSSPFVSGRDTGLQSARSLIFKRMPRTGIPEEFRSYVEYESYVELLVKTGCIDKQRRVWFDLRPHPVYETLEFRICDLPTKVDEVIAVAALIQALVARLMQLHRDNQSWRPYRTALIEENKWRAVRYGIHGKMIDFGRQKEVPTRDLIMEVMDFVDGVLDYLGSRKEVEYIERILKDGTSADRQLDIYRSTDNFEAVVDLILNETMKGI